MNLELVKSWFILAEICAVLSGLVIIAGGFFIVPAIQVSFLYVNTLEFCDNALSSESNILNNDIGFKECMEEMQTTYGNWISDENKKGYLFILVGFILGLDSLIFWLFGRYKLIKAHIKDYKFMLLIVFIDIIIFILLALFIII